MRDILKKAMLKIFPELSGGLHLDRYARVLAVSDEPEQGGSCERFRPRYAVDLEILTPEGEKDEAYSIYKDVPLPVAGAGMERGCFGFPDTGTLVVVGFAYGRPDHPLVKQVYPLGLSLPKLRTGELLFQQDAETFQRVDPDGNWTRQTHGRITDSSLKRSIAAVDSVVELVRELRRVKGSSTEEIGGVKSVEALGGILLTSGGHIDMVAVDNLNFVTAADSSWIVARDWNGVTGGDHQYTVKKSMTEDVKESRLEKVGQNFTRETGQDFSSQTGGDYSEKIGGGQNTTVSGDQKIKAANIRMNAATFSMATTDGTLSFFPLLLDALLNIRQALDVLAVHTHPNVSPIVEGPQVSTHASRVGEDRSKLQIMSG